MADKTISGIVTWLKGWFYDKDEITTKENALQTQINNKASQSDLNSLSSTVSGKADSVHTHSSFDVVESNALTHIGTSANATQSAINSKLDTIVGNLTSADIIKIVTTLPTASASTMNALYLLRSNSQYDIYITVENSGSYAWEKLDDDVLSDLSIAWSDVTGRPSVIDWDTLTFVPKTTDETGAITFDYVKQCGESMSKTINGIVTWLRSWFYTKSEVDSLISTGGGIISIEDTDLFDVLDCINTNFDNFGDNILYAPLLNGTETVYTIPYDANGTSINFQPIISNNQLKDGAGYLSDGWDNTVNWELTFEYYTTGDNNGYTVIPLGTDKRDYNGIQQWYNKQLNFYVNGDKPTGYLNNASLRLNTWVSVKITKEDYIWKVYSDNILKTTFDLSSYSSIVDTWTTICIGVDRNMSRNSAVIRNIIVKEI